jgi:glutaconate CoA-transferase subunit B
MADLFGFYLQGGLIDVALLGGAQIDRHGNLNTTVIGDYNSPTVRLPGSGGACEIATNARALMYIMRLSTRSFVERLDFCTSPSYPANDVEYLDIPGGGPQRVITDKAIFDFDNTEHDMQLTSLHPGITLKEVQGSIGWEIRIGSEVNETPFPTVEELGILRTELDPKGLYR